MRYIFPIHLIDNKFGGTAVYMDLFNLSNFHQTGRFWDLRCASDDIQYRFVVDKFDIPFAGIKFLKLHIHPLVGPPPPPVCPAGHANNLGLTPLGRFAIQR